MKSVMGGLKTLVVALAALLIAVGLTACGGGDSSSSATTEASQGQTESKPSDGASKQSAKSDEKGKSGSGGAEGQSGNSSPSASDFTPKHHSDSGGGSQQFEVKGADNSVQEFGEEADTSEFDEAATAVHDFLDARAEGNWAAACEYMSKNTIESLEKLAAQAKQIEDKSCAGVLEKLINPAAKGALKTEAEQANVRSLRTKGEQAFVIYTVSGGTVYAMPMANEGGDWKVASLAGTPLS
jgi:hypothetical protein